MLYFIKHLYIYCFICNFNNSANWMMQFSLSSVYTQVNASDLAKITSEVCGRAFKPRLFLPPIALRIPNYVA